MYCKKCGGKIESYASNCPFCGEKVASNSVQATYTAAPSQEERSHRGVGKWLLTYIVCSIPLVNLIMMFVWAFGEKSKKDPTFRSWAKMQLLVLLIAMILVIALVAIIIATGINLNELE